MPSTSQVIFVTSPELVSEQSRTIDDPALTIAHSVRLHGLRPNRSYTIYVASRDADNAVASSKAKPTTFATLNIDPNADVDFRLSLSGPKRVYAGSDLYLVLSSTQLAGPAKHLYLLGASGLPDSISYRPICRMHNPTADEKNDCLVDPATSTPFVWNGSDNAHERTLIRLRTAAATAPGLYTVDVTARAAGITRTASYSFTVEPPPAKLLSVRPGTVPAIPGLTKWESNMKTLGKKWCVPGEVMSFGYEGQVWYYDGGRVYLQIADYTGDPSWLDCAQNILRQYRDQAIARNGNIQQWRVFPHGLAMNYWRTNDETSRSAVILLSKNAPYAAKSGSPFVSAIRETSYVIETYIKAEQLTGQRDPHLARAVDFLIGIFDQLFAQDANVLHQLFFDGLGAEALIQYYELTEDPRIPPTIKRMLDWVWEHGRDSSGNRLLYNPLAVPLTSSTTCTNLVVPAFAWYWSVTGDEVYRERGDHLFRHSFDVDISYSGKIFSQNYRWSFDFVRWRSGGKYSATHPLANRPGMAFVLRPEITSSNSKVAWTTLVPSSSQVEFGPFGGEPVSTDIDLTPKTFHSVTLPTLAYTVYNLRAKSVDEVGNLSISPVTHFLTNPAIAQPGAGEAWVDRSWSHRIKLTVNRALVAGTIPLTDFPVLVALQSQALVLKDRGGAVENGNDFLFADEQGNRLDADIQNYDAVTGKLTAWVRMPALSNVSNTVFYMYFGKPGVSQPPSSGTTWRAGYLGVWHLEEALEAGSGTPVKDSSANGYHAEPQNMVTAAGVVGKGVGFGVETPSSLRIPGAGLKAPPGLRFTISAWIRPKITNWQQRVFSAYDAVGKRGYELSVGNTTAITVNMSAGLNGSASTAQTISTLTKNQWSHVAGTLDENGFRVMINGQPVPLTVTGNSTPQFVPSGLDSYAGRIPNRDIYTYYGDLDELRVSSPKSNDWLLTEYNNQSSPTNFISVGQVEMLSAE